MNKVILGLILAVCVLGMALMILNERLGRKPEARPAPAAEQPQRPSPPPVAAAAVEPPAFARELEAEDAMEQKDAREALAPPRLEDESRSERIGEAARRPEAAPVGRVPEIPRAEPEPAPRRPEQARPAAREHSAPAQTAQPRQQPAQSQPKAAQDGPQRAVTRLVVFARDKGATVRIAGNGRMNYKSITLEDPDRVVLDMDGEWQFPPAPGIPKNDLVSNVRVGKNGDKTRVVIDLKGKPRTVRLLPAKNGTGVDVRVDR